MLFEKAFTSDVRSVSDNVEEDGLELLLSESSDDDGISKKMDHNLLHWNHL
jgi:hypothetical protein